MKGELVTNYNPTTDGSKYITADSLFSILSNFAEAMTRPAEEVIAALGYTTVSTEDVSGGVFVEDASATPGNDDFLWIQTATPTS